MRRVKRIVSAFLALLTATCLFSGCGEEEGDELFVYMPDGAPALALAKLMAEDEAEDGVTYRVVSPSLISATVTNKDEDKNADLCVLPLTAASKLLGKGDAYQMLGAVTHGNLYLLAKAGGTFSGLSDLVGKKIGVLQINQVPGLTLKATLNKHGVAWQELKNDENIATDRANLVAISGAEAVGVVEADYFLIAEPAATVQTKKGFAIVGDLQALYGGEQGYPQAVLVAKKEVVQARAEWTADFVTRVEGSVAWLESASGEDLVETVTAHLADEGYATTLKAATLTPEVVERCGIYFTYASACAAETENFLRLLCAIDDKAAAIPQREFYWTKR